MLRQDPVGAADLETQEVLEGVVAVEATAALTQLRQPRPHRVRGRVYGDGARGLQPRVGNELVAGQGRPALGLRRAPPVVPGAQQRRADDGGDDGHRCPGGLHRRAHRTGGACRSVEDRVLLDRLRPEVEDRVGEVAIGEVPDRRRSLGQRPPVRVLPSFNRGGRDAIDPERTTDIGVPTGDPFFGNQYTNGGYVPGSFSYASAAARVAESVGEAASLSKPFGVRRAVVPAASAKGPRMPFLIPSLIAVSAVALIGGVATFVYLRSKWADTWLITKQGVVGPARR